METIGYLILALLAIWLIGPALFADRSPIPETSGNVHKITNSVEFDALLKAAHTLVVDFYADWCPPCRAIAPIFSSLADKYAIKNHLAFAKVNVDQVNDIAGRYGVSAMPTFVFFQGGQPTPVKAELTNPARSVVLVDGRVERVRGADSTALTAVVLALHKRAKAGAGMINDDDRDKGDQP